MQARGEATAVAAAIALSIAGYGFYTALPMLIGAMAQAKHFSDQQIGWLSSGELGGMLMGSLAAPIAVRTGRLRRFASISLALVALGLVGSWAVADFGQSVGMRLIGGFGGGLAYSIAVSFIAITRHPIRFFGIMNAAAIFAAALQDYVTPDLAVRHGLPGALLPPGIMVAASLLLLPAMRAGMAADDEPAAPPDRQAMIGASGWLFLAAVGICHIAPGALWTYVERLAVVSGIGTQTLATTLTAGLIAGGIASFGAEKVAIRIGARNAMIVMIVLLTAIMASNLLVGEVPFVVRYLAFGCIWNLLIVFQLSSASELDGSGRLAGLVPAAQNMGIVAGPISGSAILAHGVTIGTMLAIMSLTLVPGMAIALFLQRSRRWGGGR